MDQAPEVDAHLFDSGTQQGTVSSSQQGTVSSFSEVCDVLSEVCDVAEVFNFFLFYFFIGFNFIIYTVLQFDLPPLRPQCGKVPGRDSNPSWAAQRQGPRPPHLILRDLDLNYDLSIRT